MTKERYACDGDLNLSEMQKVIRQREALALQLSDCVVATDKNNLPINILEFEEVPDIPIHIVLVKANDPQPIGTNEKVLTDVLVINNQFTSIDFYR